MTATAKSQGGKGNNGKATLAPFVGFSDRGYIHYRPRIVQKLYVQHFAYTTVCIDTITQCTIADRTHN